MSAKSVFLGVAFVTALSAQAQFAPPQPEQKHLVALEAGFDHSLVTLNLRYGRYLPALRSAPFVEVTQNTALPGFDNFRAQLGVHSWQGSTGHFLLASRLSLQAIRAANKVGAFHSLGAVVEASPGLLFNRFGLGLNVTWNPMLATHIRHTDAFRNDYYSAVKDGWYRQTATNLRAGAYLLYRPDRRRSLEVNLKGGYQHSGSLDQLLPPVYLLIGVNKRF